MLAVSRAKPLELPPSSAVPHKSTISCRAVTDISSHMQELPSLSTRIETTKTQPTDRASKANSRKSNETRSSRSSTYSLASRLEEARVKLELARLTKIQNEEKLREEEEIAAEEAELERQRAETEAELERQKAETEAKLKRQQAEADAEVKRKRAELLRRKTAAEDERRVKAAELEASLYRFYDDTATSFQQSVAKNSLLKSSLVNQLSTSFLITTPIEPTPNKNIFLRLLLVFRALTAA